MSHPVDINKFVYELMSSAFNEMINSSKTKTTVIVSSDVCGKHDNDDNDDYYYY